MSAFLFVVPPLAGHINPAVAVAAELAERGHRVAWAGDPPTVRRLVGDRATVYPCALPYGDDPDAAARPPGIRGAEALGFLWERYLVPLADAMAPGVRAAVAGFRPDAVVADQQALAGSLVAERAGVPWATSAEFGDVLSGMPRVRSWLDGLLGALRARVGDPAQDADPRFSPHLVLAFTTPELAGTPARGAERIRWVGPCLSARPDGPDFPWEWLDPARPKVLVSLGTANTDVGARFLGECREALRGRADRAQAVIADPGGVLGEPGTGDEDALVLPQVPQLALLRHVDAVVCHAGHNTVCEALWNGVPLVVAPIRDDQPVIAGQVEGAGAGVRVRFSRVTAPRLGAALDTVLYEPGPRGAAERIKAAFRAAGGASVAAIHLERLTAPARAER